MSLSIEDKKLIQKILPTYREALKTFTFSRVAQSLDCYKKSSLICACAISSHALAILLEKIGYFPEIVIGVYIEKSQPVSVLDAESVNHVWVELGDHLIDLTATQFGDKPIIFRKKNGTGKKFVPLIRTTARNLKREVTDWGHGQSPTSKTANHILRNYQDISGENLGV